MASNPQHSRYGFTLLELVVVISIITVMAAMLLPFVQTIRASAQRANCVSNVKQINLAMSAYLNENEGLIPPCKIKAGCGSPDGQDAAYLNSYYLGQYIDRTTKSNNQMSDTDGTTFGRMVGICPSDTRGRDPTYRSRAWSYGLNANYGPVIDVVGQWSGIKPIGKLTNIASRVLICEARAPMFYPGSTAQTTYSAMKSQWNLGNWMWESTSGSAAGYGAQDTSFNWAGWHSMSMARGNKGVVCGYGDARAQYVTNFTESVFNKESIVDNVKR